MQEVFVGKFKLDLSQEEAGRRLLVLEGPRKWRSRVIDARLYLFGWHMFRQHLFWAAPMKFHHSGSVRTNSQRNQSLRIFEVYGKVGVLWGVPSYVELEGDQPVQSRACAPGTPHNSYPHGSVKPASLPPLPTPKLACVASRGRSVERRSRSFA
jgi:hypothetical protein